MLGTVPTVANDGRYRTVYESMIALRNRLFSASEYRMNPNHRPMPRFVRSSPSSQRGVVLYVALIMLILLTMIGLVGMQVTGLQEKMSSNYRSANQAFQNAEASLRATESNVEAQINRSLGSGTPVAISTTCDDGFDAQTWSDAQALGKPALMVRSIGKCISGSSSQALGTGPVSEDPNPVFQITAYANDYPSNATADATVDSIFIP